MTRTTRGPGDPGTREPGAASLEVLSRAECLRLLPTVPTGWLAFSHPSRPRLVLVNFVVQQDRVVLRTAPGDAVGAAENGQVMSFGASSTDTGARTGWSVTVTGTGTLLGTLLDPTDATVAPLHPWAPGARDHVVGIAAEDVTGRRLTVEAALGTGEAAWGWWG